MKQAWRNLVAGRTTTLAAIVTIALGIGTATATYSVVEGVLIRSLPFKASERLVGIWPIQVQRRVIGKTGKTSGGTTSAFTFESIRTQSRAFEEVSAHRGEQPILTEMGEPQRVTVWRVKSNLFEMLGFAPLLGRSFSPQDDAVGATDTVVLSHAFWTTRFGNDPAAVGKQVVLDGKPVDIIGVMPQELDYPAKTAMWRSLGSDPGAIDTSSMRVGGGFWMLGRLKPTVSVHQAVEDLDLVAASLASQSSSFKGFAFNVVPLQEQLVGATRQPLLIMFGAVGFVLFVACANVANLLLARVVARQREISIRLALGSSRIRIVREFLTESLSLSVVGGIAGILIAIAAVPWIVDLAGEEIPGAAKVSVNVNVLLASVAAMLGTGILFGLIPAFYAARKTDANAFRYRGELGNRTRNRASDVLLILQVALTVVLVTGAGLLVSSFVHLLGVKPGIDPDRVITAHLRLPGVRYTDGSSVLDFTEQTLARLSAIPGALSATVSTGIPLSEGVLSTTAVEGNPDVNTFAVITAASPDFFKTFGITLDRGEGLDADTRGRVPIIVNRELARLLFPSGDPMGKRLTFYDKLVGTVVGVSSDTIHRSVRRGSAPEVFLPLSVTPERFLKLSVRTSSEPKSIAAAMRTIVKEIDPVLPIDKLTTVRELISESIARDRFYTTLLVIFSGLTLAIAASGIFGMVSFMTTRRLQEFGIRMALGAVRRQVLILALRRAVILAAIGLVVGLLAARWTSVLAGELLFRTTSGDATVQIVGTLIVLGIAVLAGLAPAMRATRVDPAITLKAE